MAILNSDFMEIGTDGCGRSSLNEFLLAIIRLRSPRPRETFGGTRAGTFKYLL